MPIFYNNLEEEMGWYESGQIKNYRIKDENLKVSDSAIQLVTVGLLALAGKICWKMLIKR